MYLCVYTTVKIGKKISETLFYRLKAAKAKRGESEEWLDYHARYQFIEFYRKRMEDLELVQRKLLKAFIEETEKEKQDKLLINHLPKTIAENSKVLAEFGISPPVLSKIKSLISMNYGAEKNEDDEVIRRLRIQRQNIKSGIYLPMDNEDDHQNESLECDDPQMVF